MTEPLRCPMHGTVCWVLDTGAICPLPGCGWRPEEVPADQPRALPVRAAAALSNAASEIVVPITAPPDTRPAIAIRTGTPSTPTSEASTPTRSVRWPRFVAALFAVAAILLLFVFMNRSRTPSTTTVTVAKPTGEVAPEKKAPVVTIEERIHHSPLDAALWETASEAWKANTSASAGAHALAQFLRRQPLETQGVNVAEALKAAGQLQGNVYLDLAQAADAVGDGTQAAAILNEGLRHWPNSGPLLQKLNELTAPPPVSVSPPSSDRKDAPSTPSRSSKLSTASATQDRQGSPSGSGTQNAANQPVEPAGRGGSASAGTDPVAPVQIPLEVAVQKPPLGPVRSDAATGNVVEPPSNLPLDAAAIRAASWSRLVDTTKSAWASAQSLIDSGATNSYLRAGDAFKEAMNAIKAFEVGSGADRATQALSAATKQKLDQAIRACVTENKVNKSRKEPLIPCPQGK